MGDKKGLDGCGVHFFQVNSLPTQLNVAAPTRIGCSW